MPISIRNPRVEQLARDLARKRKQTMTEVIVDALERASQGSDSNRLRDVNRQISERLLALGKKPGPPLTREERDAMWGRE